jgi:hypothetical protein
LPEQFWTITQNVIGDAGRYTVVKGTRRVARLAMYGSPSVKRALAGIEIKDVRLMHTFEHIDLDPLILDRLRGYTSYENDMGKEELDRQVAQFRAHFDNLRVATVTQMLAAGLIYFDGEGNLLPSSSGAVTTIDFQIPANNKNQLNGIIAASWATATTNIPAQINALKTRSLQDTGYPLEIAFYGKNILTYLTQNDYVVDYLSRNPTFAEKFISQNEIPQGLFGLRWIPVYHSFYEDANGTNREIFGADTVTFTPAIDATVYEMLQGSYRVPTTFAVASDARAAVNNFKLVNGMFSYAAPQIDPPSVRLYAGDTFLPVWKVPGALFIADTTP